MDRNKSKVRDGYLSDLPEDIQKNVMECHKIIVKAIDALLDDSNYEDLLDSRWAMSCIDDFKVMPSGKGQVGSVRIFKKGKSYECMIQLTGHFRNHQYGWIEELLHEFIKNIYATVRPTIRKKFDMTLKNEGDMGNPEEGFDIYPSKKIAEEMWKKFDDRKIKSIKESTGIDYDSITEGFFHKGEKNTFGVSITNLPSELSELIKDTNVIIIDKIRSSINEDEWKMSICHDEESDKYDINAEQLLDMLKIDTSAIAGHTYVAKEDDGTFYGNTMLTPDITMFFSNLCGEEDFNKVSNFVSKMYDVVDDIIDKFNKKNPGKTLRRNTGDSGKIEYIEILYDQSYAEKLWLYLKNSKKYPFTESSNESGNTIQFKKLPEGLRNLIKDTHSEIINMLKEKVDKDDKFQKNKSLYDKMISLMKDGYGETHINEKMFDGNIYTVVIPDILGELSGDKDSNCARINDLLSIDYKFFTEWKKKNPGKKLSIYETGTEDGNPHDYILMTYDKEYAKKLTEYIDDPKNHPFTEAAGNDSIKEELKNGPIATSEPKVEYNTNMTESQAKNTLATLSRRIIDGKDNKVTQYTANIYANIITKNLLPRWSKGYKKLVITLDTYQSFPTLEFKIPKMTQDFVARFIDGRELISGFLHRDPVIKLKMSPRIFHSMKNPNDAYNFFKAAVMYYDTGLERASVSLMAEIRKLGTEMRELICTTNLSGLVTIPLQMLFVFDDVDMSDKNTFKISKEDIDTVNRFVRNIYSRYAAPEKEKKKIIDDIKDVVKTLREQCEYSDNIVGMSHFTEEAENFLYGGFDDRIKKIREYHIEKCVDTESMINSKNPEVKYLQEKFGVKKLKKLPLNIVAYITIETETIKDANDKLMIASYCLSKIEIVEWYIELLEVGSSKYVVPHNKPYLESLRTQLLACYKKIMDTPIPKRDRPLIDVQYPAGYEG